MNRRTKERKKLFTTQMKDKVKKKKSYQESEGWCNLVDDTDRHQRFFFAFSSHSHNHSPSKSNGVNWEHLFFYFCLQEQKFYSDFFFSYFFCLLQPTNDKLMSLYKELDSLTLHAHRHTLSLSVMCDDMSTIAQCTDSTTSLNQG